MTVSISNSLVGLTLLSGTNSLAAFGGSFPTESAAVRAARAAFTLPATIPPWKQATTPDTTQIAAIKRLTSLIDKPATGVDALPNDVQTSFTAYKALDRLRVLAESSAKATTGSSERGKLDQLFAKGLSDLQVFLAEAPSDRLDLSFGLPTRRAESVSVPVHSALEVKGEGVVTARDAPLPGIMGTEQFTITLRKFGITDQVIVDLAQGIQPPTLDSIANQINAAITAIPLRNPDGSLATDSSGNPQPRWQVRFVPNKDTDKWGFALKNPSLEDVSIDQTNGADALVVATGQTPLDAPASVRLLRIDDPAAGGSLVSLGSLTAYDRLGTERAKLLSAATSAKPAPKGVTLSSPHVDAATSADAIVTAADGASYIVGTAAGDLGANRPAGSQDLTLTKIDSEGRVLWQRMLGASSRASGAAVSLAANGDVLVAGTVTGAFDGQASDGDILVARFNTSGDEHYATLVRASGADTATAIASGADGNIYVGGRSATGGSDAVIVKLDIAGKITDRRTLASTGSESISALTVAPDGSLLALSNESGQAVLRRIDTAALATDLASINLGTADARALAVAPDGSIAVGGATQAALSGSQANGLSGNRDGFVARIDTALSAVTISYIGTAGTDEVDSLAFLNGRIYAGGRTTGTIGAARIGPTDGFVVALDIGTGAQLSATQFGRTAQRTEPVRIAAAAGGATALGALGLARGTLTPLDSDSLVAQTSLRTGDSFSVKAQGGVERKISIAADDSLLSLATKVRKALGSGATVTTPTVDGKKLLRIEAKAGSDVELSAGPVGGDALAKLGLVPARITVPEIAASKRAPSVRPGGTYGLALSEALNLGTAKDAGIAAKKIREAISTAQTAYRSLYWDEGKAALVNGGSGGGKVSPYLAAQASRYQAALDRISAFTGV